MVYARYVEIPRFEEHRLRLLNFRKINGDLSTLWDNYNEEQSNLYFPEIVKEFKNSFGITVIQLIFFSIPPNKLGITDSYDPKSIFVHTDSYNEDNMPYDTNFAINLPLENCNGTYTIFYKYVDKPTLVHYPVFTGLGLSHSVVEEVDRFEVCRPSILRINEPHGVWNPTDRNRLVATIRFKENLEYLIERN